LQPLDAESAAAIFLRPHRRTRAKNTFGGGYTDNLLDLATRPVATNVSSPLVPTLSEQSTEIISMVWPAVVAFALQIRLAFRVALYRRLQHHRPSPRNFREVSVRLER
jgi:hypothetical protein